jgi:hypothetical protein
MVSLDAVARLQPEQFVGPEAVEEQISGGTASAIARHACLTAIGIEDANAEVGVTGVRSRRDGNAISTCAVVTIADATREIAEISNCGELFCFENQIVISEALKLCESHIWSAPAERSGDGALDYSIGAELRGAIQSGVAASLCHRTPN